MSDYDISQLMARLESMEKALNEFQRKIYAALLGEVDGQITGLIPEHRQCRGQIGLIQGDIDAIKKTLDELSEYKKEIKIYASIATVIASGVLTVAAELARHYLLK